MKLVASENPDKDFFFVMGTDLLEGMENWGNGKELKEEVNFLIIMRTGYALKPETLPRNYILIETTFVGASSTVVRQRVHEYYRRKMMANKEEDKFPGGEKNGARVFSSESWRVKRNTAVLDDFHDKYLGVYGVVSLGVIDYIKANKLYQD